MSILAIFKKKKNSKSRKVSSTQDVAPAEQASNLDVSPDRMQNVIKTCTSPAFQEAWRKHWDDLSASEQGAWSRQYPQSQTPLQLQKKMREMDKNHLDDSLLRKISDRTLNFLQVVDLLMRGATVAVQGAPNVGSVVLGVFRVVIDVRYFSLPKGRSLS
jgi:hypothetical protein